MISALKMTVLSVIGVLIASLLLAVTSTTAQASSIYDDDLIITEQLILRSNDTYYPCSGYQQDWTDSWTEWIYDADFWSFGGVDGYQEGFIEAWESAKINGSWVIMDYYHVVNDASNGVVPTIVFSPTDMYIEWDWSFGVGTVVKANDASSLYSMPMQVFQGEGCSGAVWAPNRPGYAIIGNDGGHTQLFAVGDGVDASYPTGYEGPFVPTQDLTPPTSPITGTVDCGGENPSLMTIAQAGNNGAATLTYVSLGISEWSYDLRTDVPYSFNVLCGTKLAAPFGAVSATTSSNLWTCDVYGPEPWYCVLS